MLRTHFNRLVDKTERRPTFHSHRELIPRRRLRFRNRSVDSEKKNPRGEKTTATLRAAVKIINLWQPDTAKEILSWKSHRLELKQHRARITITIAGRIFSDRSL
jgi:hypothetical protein